MTTTVLRRPTFDLRFITENSEYHIVHDLSVSLKNKFMTESVISMTTANAMEDDSSAFSFVLAGDMEWTKILNANDMVVLKINPNEVTPNDLSKKDKVKNDVIMIGLVTEVRLEGTYSDNTKMYRVTGQSFAKAFIQFELSTIRQVTYTGVTGWLENESTDSGGTGGGFYAELSRKTVAETVKAMLDRFMQYMEYNFVSDETDNTKLLTRIRTEITSWSEDEMLQDPTPFLNFEGSFNQLLGEIVTKPFCEKFFEVWISEEGNEKAKFVVRRTPFDEEDWKRLPRHELYSRDVITESVAHSDMDAYSVFSIFPENSIVSNTSALVRPKYHPSLIKKYGYKMLEVTHSYLSPMNDNASDSDVGNLIDRYSTRLYNWYSNNPNFYEGEIVVIGHPDYRLGNRLLYRDTENSDVWEYYIESVEHEFTYTQGYTTTLGVTRGLRIETNPDSPNYDLDGGRFTNTVGDPQDFKGGYFGEASIGTMINMMEGAQTDSPERAGLGNTVNNSNTVKPAEGVKTSGYGNRYHPISGQWRMHEGTDIAGGSSVIRAMASGVVVTARFDSGWGRYIEIDHGNLNGEGKVLSRYAHLEQSHVAVGQNVTAGEQIGVMGQTGTATGVHLHFEMEVNGQKINPETWFTWREA